MIKSYREWQLDQLHLKEFNIRTAYKSALGQGMSPEVKANMERLGSMIGFAPSGWNVFSKDSSQRGVEFLNTLQSDKANEAMKMVKQGSPLQLAYSAMEKLKARYGNGPMNPKDLEILVQVLLNANSNGNIDFGELRELWDRVIGIQKNPTPMPTDQSTERNRQLAVKDNVFTPLHLLAKTFSIGGGIFAAPSNISALRKDSSEIIKQLYPDMYRKMYRATYGMHPDDNDSVAERKRKPIPTPTPPAPPSTPIDPNQFNDALNNLTQVMKTTPDDAKALGQAINNILPLLQKMHAAITTPKPTT